VNFENNVEHLRSIFARDPDAPLLIAESTGALYTRGDIAARARSVARFLEESGVGVGDKIGFVARNSTALSIMYFGAWTAGAQVVPVNPQLRPYQIAEILELAGVKQTFASMSEKKTVADISHGTTAFRDELDAPADGAAAELDVMSLSDDAGERPVFDGHTDDTPFLRIYTSGTTSKPKGIDLTIGGIVGNERAFCNALGVSSSNRFYNFLPMSYLGGIHNLLLLPLSVGASTVIGQPLGGAGLFGFWDNVKRFEVNTLWFTSAMLSMLMSLRDDEEMDWIKDTIRLGLVGMAPLQPSVKEAFEDRFGFRLHENYAMTETAFLTSSRPEKPYRPGSSGSALPAVEIDILDDNGNELPAGQTGEIRVRSPYLMKGYADAPARDLENQTAKGFLTGDLAYMDDGELFVCGRKKDLIIRGGQNISPAQVEEAILQHPATNEAAVVGIPDQFYGEEVAAMVVATHGAELNEAVLMQWMKQHIAHFQRPKKLMLVDKLPLGLTGKVNKREIAELLTEPTNS